MANNNNTNDVAVGLAVLAGTALAGYVGYKVLKAVGEYEQASVAEQLQAERRAVALEARKNYVPPPNCHKHGQDAELCKSCKQCIECRGGIGDAANRWCQECDDDFYAS
jgi:hypothetical protein